MATMHEQLYKAMKGFGTDEAAVYKVLGSVTTQQQWEGVQADYKKKYGKDLIKDLKSELNDKEERRCAELMQKRGIDWDGPDGPAPAAAGAKPAEQSPVDILHKAMDGLGTDEKAVMGVVNSVKTQAEWDAIRQDYQKKYPGGKHKGDLVKEMKSELSAKEERQVTDAFRPKKINWDGPIGAGAAAPAAPAPAPAPAPQAAHGQQASHGEKPRSVADIIYAAVKGHGTDEDAIYDAVGTVSSNDSWAAVKRDFKRKYPDCQGGDIQRALTNDLTRKELEKVKQILRNNKVDWDATGRPSGGGGASSRSEAQRLLEAAERKGPGPVTCSVHVSGEIYGYKENITLGFEDIPYLGELRASAEAHLQREATRQCPPGEPEQHVSVTRMLLRSPQGWRELVCSDHLYDGCQVYAAQAADTSGPDSIPEPSPPRSRYVVPGTAPSEGPPAADPCARGGYQGGPGIPPAGYGAPPGQPAGSPPPYGSPPGQNYAQRHSGGSPQQYGSPPQSHQYTAHRSSSGGSPQQYGSPQASYQHSVHHSSSVHHSTTRCGGSGSPDREQLMQLYDDARRRAEQAREALRLAESEELATWNELQSSPR
eukprot:TRINITY_DN65199_c0_g1_i1.p1 TRINITY_DN65199_c0_g1~~TRINITY_DN65199_c0_g1_i1.p1  ORF type:complete len:624 (+),score=181.78 TRINITY_DN65199_c0_g1_i1:92-1873(+)